MRTDIRSAYMFCFLLFGGCATVAPLSGEASKVRVISNSPHLKECKYLGEVVGEGEVAFMATDSAIHESARRNIKEAAAKLGANTVELTNEAPRSFAGEAYKCNW